jgi:hypothetical protein
MQPGRAAVTTVALEKRVDGIIIEGLALRATG